MISNLSEVHTSVLLPEVLDYLKPEDGQVFVDGNLGMGGHTEGILELCGPSGVVIGFEWDQDAVELAKERLARFGERVKFVHDNFANIKGRLAKLGVLGVDGLLLDLGLSSFQLDKSDRGFSFKGRQPLDMRMDERQKTTAAHLVNKASEAELADIFYYYGEERQARRIASFVVNERKKKEISTTEDLVAVIQAAIPKRYWPKKIHVATKVFQGLRIVVNQEMENLEKVLASGVEVLNPGALFLVITFHSLEDRLVKRAFRDNQNLDVITRKPITANLKECAANPRARSAKLRVAQKKEGLK